MIVEAALTYAQRGLPIFPLRGKLPLINHGFKDVSTKLSVINDWWSRFPNANIGLPTGSLSGLIVLDVDPRHGGMNLAYDGVLSVLVPDYRGKIAGIRLMSGGIEIEVNSLLGADPKDLAGKLHHEGYYGNRYNEALEFDDNGKAFTSTKVFPRHLVVALFSKSTADLIDERSFDATSPYLPGDLTIEEVGKDIENLIKGGESDTIEFKSQIPKNQEAIAIAAVAFANQKGGTILVGVDNEGQILGSFAENVKQTLTNILRDRCERPLAVAVQETMVQGKAILVVTVPDAKDKPYQVKDKGFYLRAGATNRQITRYELDAIYGTKPENLNLGFPGTWST